MRAVQATQDLRKRSQFIKREMHMKAKTFMNTFKLNVTSLRENVIFARAFR